MLVTGANGFIGSHLTERLLLQGAQVKALVQYNSFNDNGWLEEVPANANLEIVSGDIRDSAFCRRIAREVSVIFNLAALIAIPYSYIAPESYIDTNVKGALNIAQAAMDNAVERVVQISTSEVYGTARYVPIDENHPLQPQSPYSASKIGADAIAMSFYHAFFLPVILARPFNTYGPRQSARAVIPTIIAQLAAGSHVIKLGDLSPTRDLNYVEDTCRALIALSLSDDAVGQAVNIGSNAEISIGALAEKIIGLMNADATVEIDEARLRPSGSEVQRLWCDNGKLKKLTGFQHTFSLEEGLQKTIDWFSNPQNLKKYKSEVYNV